MASADRELGSTLPYCSRPEGNLDTGREMQRQQSREIRPRRHDNIRPLQRAEDGTPLLAGESDPLSDGRTIGDSLDEGQTQDIRDNQSLPWWRTPSVPFMLVPLFVYMVAYGGMMVPQINLIQDLLCREFYSHHDLQPDIPSLDVNDWRKPDDRCASPEVEAAAVKFLMACQLLSGILSAITSPRLGALSDQYGRLKILIISSVGRIGGEAITVCAVMYPQRFRSYWIYACAVLDGLCGSSMTTTNMAHLYVADCTTPLNRTAAFNYLHAWISLGVTLGPFLVKQILQNTRATIVTVYVGVLCCDVLFLLTLFVIPESRIKDDRPSETMPERSQAPWQQRAHEAIVALVKPLQILNRGQADASSTSGNNLRILIILDLVTTAVAAGSLTVAIVYPRKQFHWGAADQSGFISAVNASRLVCLMALGPLLMRVLHSPRLRRRPTNPNGHLVRGCNWADRVIIRISLFSDALGHFGYTTARTPRLFLLSGVLSSIGVLSSPTLRSALTKCVDEDRTGELLGAIGLLHSVMGFIAPIIFNGIFIATAGGFRQAEFLVLAILLSLSFGLSWTLSQNG